MRLFTGIAIPTEIKDRLEKLVRGLKPHARIRWSPVANLHVTTKFIGEWPEERLAELQGALEAVEPRGAFPVSIRGLDWFPDRREPRVFYAGIEAPDALRELAERIEGACEGLGIERERRWYSPHLTLARIKSPGGLGGLRRAVQGLPLTEFGEFTAECFHLYLSEPQPGGSVYTSLRKYPV